MRILLALALLTGANSLHGQPPSQPRVDDGGAHPAAPVHHPAGQAALPRGAPIVVPFGRVPEVTFSEPRVVFDLNADGLPEVISWPINGGFLVLDRDGDGQITSGKELFGDSTFPGKTNGFDALAYEGTKVGGSAVLAAGHRLYDKLKVWVDEDQDGITDPGELRPLSDFVRRLFLFYELSGTRDEHGNIYRLKGEAVYDDGEQRPIYDVAVTQRK